MLPTPLLIIQQIRPDLTHFIASHSHANYAVNKLLYRGYVNGEDDIYAFRDLDLQLMDPTYVHLEQLYLISVGRGFFFEINVPLPKQLLKPFSLIGSLNLFPLPFREQIFGNHALPSDEGAAYGMDIASSFVAIGPTDKTAKLLDLQKISTPLHTFDCRKGKAVCLHGKIAIRFTLSENLDARLGGKNFCMA
ncbi:hypothetical protein VNO77_19268 [Canavalia gladiata]|uniref:Uncharacterized protein n=1 Tax=Canavalia gladiata TaxID=3824 RepID=A0AAN9QL80_CANGL